MKKVSKFIEFILTEINFIIVIKIKIARMIAKTYFAVY